MKRILLVASAFERAHFFPEGMDSWEVAGSHPCRCVDPLEPEGFTQALTEYAQEPLPVDSPLRSLPNVFLLPHMGGATVERGVECGQRALRNVERFVAGEPLENVVNLTAFERAT